MATQAELLEQFNTTVWETMIDLAAAVAAERGPKDFFYAPGRLQQRLGRGRLEGHHATIESSGTWRFVLGGISAQKRTPHGGRVVLAENMWDQLMFLRATLRGRGHPARSIDPATILDETMRAELGRCSRVVTVEAYDYMTQASRRGMLTVAARQILWGYGSRPGSVALRELPIGPCEGLIDPLVPGATSITEHSALGDRERISSILAGLGYPDMAQMILATQVTIDEAV